LRPRAIDRGIDDDVANAAGAQLLRLRRKTEECVDFAVDKKLPWLDLRVSDPMYVVIGIETDMAAIRTTNMLGREPVACTPTLLPFKSITLRILSRANNSTQPTITPLITVIAAPASMSLTNCNP
jgi:hypothetical protein